MQFQRGFSQVGAVDFGDVVVGPRVEILRGVEPQTLTGPRPPGSSGPLRRRSLADARDVQRRQSRPRRMARHARQPRIDHRHDSVNRDRTFGDIGRKDHFALSGRFDRAVLLFGRKVAMQRQNHQILSVGDRLASRLRAANLSRSRQEYQNVAVNIFRDEPVYSRRDLFGQRALVGPRQMLDRDVEPFAFRAQRGRVIEKSRNRPGVERRRHHDEFQIRSRGLLQPSEQGQREVGLQVALVKFVKRDDADILQRWVGEQSPRQHAFGQEA